MQKFLATVAAGLLLSQLAHAEILTFQYTAKVSNIEENDNAVQSSSFAGGQISLGDSMTGTITYDTALPVVSRYDYGFSTDITYNPLNSLELSMQIPTGGVNFEANYYTFAGTSYHPKGSSYTDTFSAGAYRYLYMPNGGMSQEVLVVAFGDSTHTKFSDNIPGLNALGFDSNSIRYQYVGQQKSLNLQGTITDLRAIQSVPEPETYAMLLAGLSLLGLRRCKAWRA